MGIKSKISHSSKIDTGAEVVNTRTSIRLTSVLILILALLPFSAHAREWASWCGASEAKGWHFYCDEAEEMPETPLPEVSVPQAIAPKPPIEFTAVEQLEMLQASVQESRAKAVLNPTEANVEDYIRLQAKLLVMGGSFADTWRRVVWQNPDLDYEGEHPQSNLGKKAAQAALHKERINTVNKVSADYAIIYVGSTNCPVCVAYAPDLQRFAEKYDFATMAVSSDGTPLHGWQNSVIDRGQLAQLGIETTRIPLTILYHRQLNQVTMLGVGYLAEGELINRIHNLISQEVGDAF